MKWAILALLLCAGTASAQCRQALVLALDVSGSVDEAEYRLQRDGLAEALGRPAVRRALLEGGPAVRITVFEWSGQRDQFVLLPWTEITDAIVLDETRARIQSAPRQTTSPTTALGTAMLRGFALLEQQSDCWQRTLDISGDGPSNTGPRPQDIGTYRTPPGVTVNGLTIGEPVPLGLNERAADTRDLSAYFKTYVIRGPDAFVENAHGFADYANAMERKLLRELRVIGLSGWPADTDRSKS